MTEMQQFAIELLKKEKNKISPNYLAVMWSEHKTGTSRAASRDMFGYTSAAYRTLRALAKNGIIKRHNSKTSSGYSLEHYSYKSHKP